MIKKIPSLTETCEIHWRVLFEAVEELTGPEEPVRAILGIKPVSDGIKKDYGIDEQGIFSELPHYPIDNFFLYVTTQNKPDKFLCPVYLGSGKRQFDPDSNEYYYSSKVIRQLNHEIGLRLERLKELGRGVYFTSKFLDYENEEATPEFIDTLLNSDNKEMGIVKEKVLE
jgi:hypothetical protein